LKKLFFGILMIALGSLNEAAGQWTTSGNNIFNTNTGNVGIGNNAPATLLYVAKNMTEPTITVRNLGGTGGATYVMQDNASGAIWKFKATLSGGFKIRDHANNLDVIVIEPNSFANALYIKTTDNIGIGTATPAASALVDMSSTSKGLLIPRMTQAQMQSIPAPENGLQVFCTTDGKMYIYVSQMSQWKEVAYGEGGITTSCSIGSSMTVDHVAGSVAPATKTVTYGLVTNIAGEPSKCWISSNLGASHQALAVDDNTEASAGWYWQFRRKQGYKHDGSNRTPNTTWITDIDENSDWLLINDPCALLLGSGWRIPTSTEWTNVDASGGWTNWNGPFNSALKMHAAGRLDESTGSLVLRGAFGNYWSSSQSDNFFSVRLQFHSELSFMGPATKANGISVRCLRD
jgi:hypothetical protein